MSGSGLPELQFLASYSVPALQEEQPTISSLPHPFPLPDLGIMLSLSRNNSVSWGSRHQHANLPNLDFLKAPDVPPALRAFCEQGRPLPESACGEILNWFHTNNWMHVAAAMKPVASFRGMLRVQATREPDSDGTSGVSSMLMALRKHGIPCAELHVQPGDANDVIQLCAYLDSLGQDGPRVLSVDLSAYAPRQPVPRHFGECILSMPPLRRLSLRRSVSADDNGVTLQDGFFAKAPNSSIELLEIVGPIDGELPGDVVRQWLANKALTCIVLGQCGDFAATFCQAIAGNPAGHAVTTLHLVAPFEGCDALAKQIAGAQTGIQQLTLPPCSNGNEVEWLDAIAEAIKQNTDLKSLTVARTDGELPLGEISTPIADILQRNLRIAMAMNAGVPPLEAIAREEAWLMHLTFRHHIGDALNNGTLSLQSLCNYVRGTWLKPDESTLQNVFTEARRQFEIAFDEVLNPDNISLEDVLPHETIGRPTLPPASNAPPFPDLRDDPWPALALRMETILALPEIPKPVKDFLLYQKKPQLEDEVFKRIVLWCLETKHLDILVSMQLTFADFVRRLDLRNECLPVTKRGSVVSNLRELRDAGIQFAGFSILVFEDSVMDELVEFLNSQATLATSAHIGIVGVKVPSTLGHALFGNPRLRTVQIDFPSNFGRPGQPWSLPSDFFDTLAANATLESLIVKGWVSSKTNCNFGAWIRRGAIRDITLPAGALGTQVTKALVASAGESRVEMFAITGADTISVSRPEFAALFDQRLGLLSLALPTAILQKISKKWKRQAMVSKALLENFMLKRIRASRAHADRLSAPYVDFDDELHLISNVLERNQRLWAERWHAGTRAAFEHLASSKNVSDPVVFSQVMMREVFPVIEAEEFVRASLPRVTLGTALRTREKFMAEWPKDRTGSKVFGEHFETLFVPSLGVHKLLGQLLGAGAILTNPGDYEALKQKVLGVMMDWLENTLRAERPGVVEGQEEVAAPTVTDPTPDATVN